MESSNSFCCRTSPPGGLRPLSTRSMVPRSRPSRSSSPQRSRKVRRQLGANRLNASSISGAMRISPRSLVLMRMSRGFEIGSKAARGMRAASEKVMNWRMSSASATAVEVGVTPALCLRNSSSPKCRRSLPSDWLTALWLRPSVLAARETLAVRSSASNTTNRLRSISRYRVNPCFDQPPPAWSIASTP